MLALLQGITEFLPVSSSGHLILFPALTGAEDQGQLIDVAVHIGTLVAVILYFRADVAVALRGTVDLLKGRRDGPAAHLALALIVATIPAILFGLMLKLTGLDDALRSVVVIGWTMILFGLLLWWMDTRRTQIRTSEDWTITDALQFGLWQALALIPGTSRSGIVITGARAAGFDRHSAARLSMLMSIPIIIASGTLVGIEAVASEGLGSLAPAAIAAVLACLAALLALSLMMRLLRTVSFTPYVIYRVLLGIGLLIWAYGGGGQV